MADGASSAPAPAPAPVAARGRPTAAPGPIELADEKTVQTLATPDSLCPRPPFRWERLTHGARHKYMASTPDAPCAPLSPLIV